MSTVAAISTPNAAGGIAVIRISGENAFEVCSKVFRSRTAPAEMGCHTCAYGKIVMDGKVIDDGVLTVFHGPDSYTGEDVAEISCHGGIFVTRQVLRAVIEAGAEPAPPGEFTKRAFLNGKLSLTQAEAVMDVISAGGMTQLAAASNAHEGELFRRIREVSQRLVNTAAQLDAYVDYPEEDLPEIEPQTLRNSVVEAKTVLEKLLAAYDWGMVLRQGLDTVIIGRTNAGKSTLMNSLLGFERSIVTEIEGTTRDVIEETARLGDILLRLSDTAGLRATDDLVETEGIRLAKKRAENARLVIAVFDGTRPLDEQDRELMEFARGRNAIIVINKTDLDCVLSKKDFGELGDRVIEISAKNHNCGEILKEKIEQMFKNTGAETDAECFINERQKFCAQKALEQLDAAIEGLDMGISPDCTAISIEAALDSLLELTGERASQAVVDQIFSSFCVGK